MQSVLFEVNSWVLFCVHSHMNAPVTVFCELNQCAACSRAIVGNRAVLAAACVWRPFAATAARLAPAGLFCSQMARKQCCLGCLCVCLCMEYGECQGKTIGRDCARQIIRRADMDSGTNIYQSIKLGCNLYCCL